MKHEQETARQIVELLNESTQRLDPKVAVRLEDARHAAVARVNAQGAAVAGPAGLAQMFMDYVSQHRIIMPTAMMCDAVLLAFDLPPEAYLDKGFDEWLERTSQF